MTERLKVCNEEWRGDEWRALSSSPSPPLLMRYTGAVLLMYW